MAPDITVSGGTRQKATTTNALNPPLLVTNSNDDTNNLQITTIQYENLTTNPTTFTVTGATVVSGNANVTKTGAKFVTDNILRPGDAVSGTGIPSNTVINSVTDDGFTMSANASAGGTPTITVTPKVFDANLLIEQKDFSMSGSNLNVRIRLWQGNGRKANDFNADGADDTGINDYDAPVVDQVITVNLDAYLTGARVAKGS